MNQDWNEIEALRESLREHMAEIHRLRAAGRHALEALEEYQQKGAPFMACDAAVDALRIALADEAMQRLTDVQQEIENDSFDKQPASGFHSRVSDSTDRGVEAVTDVQQQMEAALADQATYGMSITLGSKRIDPAPIYKQAESATCQESRQVEPLMDEQITELFHGNSDKWWRVDHSEFCSIARAIERVHGIFANGENSIKQPNTEQEPVAGEYAICLEDGERVLISAVFPVGHGGNKSRTVRVVWPDGIEGDFSLFSFSKLFSPAEIKEKNA